MLQNKNYFIECKLLWIEIFIYFIKKEKNFTENLTGKNTNDEYMKFIEENVLSKISLIFIFSEFSIEKNFREIDYKQINKEYENFIFLNKEKNYILIDIDFFEIKSQREEYEIFAVNDLSSYQFDYLI